MLSAVSLVLALRCARGERWAGVTTEGGAALRHRRALIGGGEFRATGLTICYP
jgi:hypothetical protein